MKSQLHESPNVLSSEEAAKIEIRSIYNAVAEAHNNRQYDRNTYPWTKMAPNMEFEMAQGGPETVDLDGYIKGFKSKPGLHVEILSCEVDVDLKTGTAIAYGNHVLTSDELSFVRRSVVVTKWRIEGTGRWQCINYKHIKGMEI